jgi:uncharacterized protein YdeI (YjbR/CyaY-like superfamily)
MKTSQNEREILSFKTQKEFEKWLGKNHDKSNGIWLRLFKKDSGEKSISHAEALDEALCYGWIDGQANKYDDSSWIQKFTPRRPKSIWSKRNTHHIERLTALAKMKPPGLAEVDKAKEDGRWEKAYDSPTEMNVPGDFLKELSKNKKSKDFFETLNKTNKYSIVWRLQTAKKPETREKRMKEIIKMLSQKKRFH